MKDIRIKMQNKKSKERANIKALAISDIPSSKKYSRKKYEIEIVDIKKIDGGIEVFIKAWKNKKQVGFGKDGSVDIERFRIFNPPILVPDDLGDVEKATVDNESGETIVSRYRVDPEEAVIQVIEHNLSVMKNIHDGKRIIKGKVGNTTSTFFPDASPETSSVDGYIRYETGASGSWVEAHDATDGTSVDTDTAGILFVGSGESNSQTGNYRIIRAFVLFDTSSIPDGDDIDSAVLSGMARNKSDLDNDAQAYINVFETTPASNTDLVLADYDQIGTTKLSSDADITSIDATDTVYTDFTLNGSGIALINKTGVTKLGFREGHDVENVQIANNVDNFVWFNQADQTGTTKDPKLVVEHTTPSTPVTVTPAAQSATFSLPAETVVTTSNVSVSPSAQVATFSTPAETISLPKTVTPAVLSAVFSIPPYGILAGTVGVNANVQVATFSLPQEVISTGRIIAIGTPQVATFNIPTYAVAIIVVINQGLLSAIFSIPAYLVLNNQLIEPSVLPATFSIPTITVIPETAVYPLAHALTFTIPAYTVIYGSIITPEAKILTFIIPTLYKFGAVWEKKARGTDSNWTKSARNNT